MKKQMIRYKAYRSMFLNFIFLTSLITIVICSSLFALFASSAGKEIGNISRSMLEQTGNAANLIHDQLYNLGKQLLNDDLINSAMFNQEIDRVQEYLVVIKLLNIQSTYPFIDHIGIYNEFTCRYINSKGLTSEDERELTERIRSSEEVYMNLHPRSIKDAAGKYGGKRDVFTFVMMPKYSLLPSKGAIVINVSANYIHELIGELKNRRSTYLFAMSEQGEILVQTNVDPQIQRQMSLQQLQPILTSKKSSDSYGTRIGGTKYLISYMKSNALKWIFVSVSTYNELLFNLNQLKKVTITLAVGVMVASLFLSVWLTNQMHNPIRKLLEKLHGFEVYKNPLNKTVNEFHLLDETFVHLSKTAGQLEPVLDVVRKNVLLRHITGSNSDPINRFEDQLTGPHFFVVLIKIDNYSNLVKSHSARMRSLLQFAICNISQEIMGKAGDMEVVVIEDDEIGILGQLQTRTYPANLLHALSEIQGNILSYFKISLTVGIGPIVSAAEEIRDSYRLAKEAVHRRFFEGIGQIYEFEQQLMEQTEPSTNSYPVELEKKLAEAVQQGKADEISPLLEQFKEFCRKMTYYNALFVINQLLVFLYKYFETSAVPVKEEAKRFLDMTHNLASCETLEQAMLRLHEICAAIAKSIEAKVKNGKQDVIEKIKEYIREHYSRPDLSLEMLADHFQLTPGYMGKLFKAHCNVSFNDFLKEVRMEKAAELLTSTDEPIQAISEKVGIYNSTYFSTLFKKKYGITPKQYRINLLSEKLM